MSGGSYDYAYRRFRDIADQIRDRVAASPTSIARPPWDPPTLRLYDRKTRSHLSPEVSEKIIESIDRERLWLAGLLDLVSQAMHDVEWVDSCDYGQGDELAAIRAVRAYLGTDPPEAG